MHTLHKASVVSLTLAYFSFESVLFANTSIVLFYKNKTILLVNNTSALLTRGVSYCTQEEEMVGNLTLITIKPPDRHHHYL